LFKNIAKFFRVLFFLSRQLYHARMRLYARYLRTLSV